MPIWLLLLFPFLLLGADERTNSLFGDFSLKAHKENYYLPLSMSREDHRSLEPSEEYRKIESQLQFSIRYDLFENLFGMDETFVVAYTQQAFWQNYTPSSPFRETLYNPEAFFHIPLTCKHLKYVNIGYAHESNGQGITYDENGEFDEQYNRSRTWNYLYGVLGIQHERWHSELKTWWRILNVQEDGTPQLYQYIGYGNVTLQYRGEKQWIKLMGRYNPSSGYGAVEASWSYPMWWRNDLFWFVKVFDGYGESLIDYDVHQSTFSTGISFSR
jgi:phospholipase A1